MSLYDEGFYDYLGRNPQAADLFNAGMGEFSQKEDQAIADQYDFSPFSRICDVGGGTGGLVSAILRKHLRVKGILFDLKEAIDKSVLPEEYIYDMQVKILLQ